MDTSIVYSPVRQLLRPRWILTTLLVIAAVGVMIWLGFWQLSRLEWRRGLNQQIMTQTALPVLNLNLGLPENELKGSEYRSVSVSGVLLQEEAVLLRNQEWEGQPGYHLLVPLKMEGSTKAVFVDRGWVPLNSDQVISRFFVKEAVVLNGILRLPMTRSEIGGVPDPEFKPGAERLSAINLIDIERLQKQVQHPLLPVYVQEAPAEGDFTPPIARSPVLEITEGPHMGYAIQWFFFAGLLACGYPFFLKKQFEKPDQEAVAESYDVC